MPLPENTEEVTPNSGESGSGPRPADVSATQSSSTPGPTSNRTAESNADVPSSAPGTLTSGQAATVVWRKLGRWLALGFASAVLFAGAYAISHSAKQRHSYKQGYSVGRASFGYWAAETQRREAMESEYRRALGRMGLGDDDFRTGSGWYVVEMRVTPRSLPALSGLYQHVDVRFDVLASLKERKWYSVTASGTLTTHGE